MAQPNHISLDIVDETSQEATPPRNTVNVLRLDSVSRPGVGNRNTQGLGDRLNSVFREIRPLVEHARMGNNARLSLPTWLPRNPPGFHQNAEIPAVLQRPQSSIAHVNLGPNSQTYIVTERSTPLAQRPQQRDGLSRSVSNDSNLSEQGQDHPDINISVNPSNNNNIHDNAENDSQSEDGTQQVVFNIIKP
ncbi:hypothetical protein EVAR_24821_1 [Eumeta japonica]|uniref:Uncharacterized protein n=1 Tax=Eumeta variegata TaxID=151549 RepID=A0A4C1W060_EUMVA|nr:hypothetical protein EVAR_24821_1 [Eumeta japonica]